MSTAISSAIFSDMEIFLKKLDYIDGAAEAVTDNDDQFEIIRSKILKLLVETREALVILYDPPSDLDRINAETKARKAFRNLDIEYTKISQIYRIQCTGGKTFKTIFHAKPEQNEQLMNLRQAQLTAINEEIVELLERQPNIAGVKKKNPNAPKDEDFLPLPSDPSIVRSGPLTKEEESLIAEWKSKDKEIDGAIDKLSQAVDKLMPLCSKMAEAQLLRDEAITMVSEKTEKAQNALTTADSRLGQLVKRGSTAPFVMRILLLLIIGGVFILIWKEGMSLATGI